MNQESENLAAEIIALATELARIGQMPPRMRLRKNKDKGLHIVDDGNLAASEAAGSRVMHNALMGIAWPIVAAKFRLQYINSGHCWSICRFNHKSEQFDFIKMEASLPKAAITALKMVETPPSCLTKQKEQAQ